MSSLKLVLEALFLVNDYLTHAHTRWRGQVSTPGARSRFLGLEVWDLEVYLGIS